MLPRYSDTTLKALTRITYLVLSLMTAAVPPTLSQESDHQPRTAASTLRKRGVAAGTVYNPKDMSTFGAKPLIDTGHMFNSVDYQVKA